MYAFQIANDSGRPFPPGTLIQADRKKMLYPGLGVLDLTLRGVFEAMDELDKYEKEDGGYKVGNDVGKEVGGSRNKGDDKAQAMDMSCQAGKEGEEKVACEDGCGGTGKKHTG